MIALHSSVSRTEQGKLKGVVQSRKCCLYEATKQSIEGETLKEYKPIHHRLIHQRSGPASEYVSLSAPDD